MRPSSHRPFDDAHELDERFACAGRLARVVLNRGANQEDAERDDDQSARADTEAADPPRTAGRHGAPVHQGIILAPERLR